MASTDAENVLIAMTTRQLNPSIPIVVRCDEETNRPKFMRAGATRVIMPHASGAMALTLAATKPYVIDLLELAADSGSKDFWIHELLVPRGSPVAGQTLKDLALGSRFGVIIIAINSEDQPIRFNPPADTTLRAGDQLITVARGDQLEQFESFVGGK